MRDAPRREPFTRALITSTGGIEPWETPTTVNCVDAMPAQHAEDQASRSLVPYIYAAGSARRREVGSPSGTNDARGHCFRLKSPIERHDWALYNVLT